MSATGADWRSICHASTDLGDDTIGELEAGIAARPDDVEARVRLVGSYWLRSEMAPRRGEHLVWLAQHRPDIELGGYGTLVPDFAPAQSALLVAVWREQAAKPGATAAILGNAATVIGFAGGNPAETELLYRRAAALEPAEIHWREQLGWHLQLRAADAEGVERVALARAALAELDAALSLATRAATSLDVRRHQVAALVLAEEWERAVDLAQRVLVDNEAEPRSWNYGNVIHDANLALGSAARARGDLARAAAFLLRAGETPGSPQLNSFGPSFELAEALLRAGDRETVRRYLASCRRFWNRHHEQIDRWLAAIDAGTTTLERSYGDDDDAAD